MTTLTNLPRISSLAITTALLLSACSAASEPLGNETLSAAKAATKQVETLCQYNPEKTSKPNPLGMRTFVRLSSRDGDVTATYEQLPSLVSAAPVPVTRALTRYLFLPARSIASARELLLQRNDLWEELIGYKDSEGFAQVNEVLSCEDKEAATSSHLSLTEKGPVQQPTCAYDPDSGVPNPLGMRHFVTIFDGQANDSAGSTEVAFVNEQFQYLVDADLPAAAAYTVTLSVFDTRLEDARSLVLSNGSRLGNELLSENGQDGSGSILSEINASLRCK
jgi:hypothetical protein